MVIIHIERALAVTLLSSFVQHGCGYVGLSQWMEQGIGVHRSTLDFFEIDEDFQVTWEGK